MASKYLSSGTAVYTESTRSISGATMTPVFETADQTNGRQVVFRISGDIYWGRVDIFVSATSVRLLSGGSLPSTDGTISEILLLDTSEDHTYQDYLDRIASMVRDADGKLTTTTGGDMDQIIAQAIATYSNDRPLYVKKVVTGTGSRDYILSSSLGSLWKHGRSMIRSIEYPAGEVPAEMLDAQDYTIHDDGTAQDGSNLKLRFLSAQPSATETFIVEFLIPMSFPRAGTANFPDTDMNFQNITTLAASIACSTLAAEYAKNTDSTINADVVNYNEKTRKYADLAENYRAMYNLSVFGTEKPENASLPMFAFHDVDLKNTSGLDFIFHGDRNR